jgi:PqqD family protein of HPr-rel-A system
MTLAGDPYRMWTVEAPQELAWRSWDGEIVLYDDRTGDIHHFDVASAAIFERILLEPRSLPDLIVSTADRLQVVADDELEDMVREILRVLGEKRVVAPVP